MKNKKIELKKKNFNIKNIKLKKHHFIAGGVFLFGVVAFFIFYNSPSVGATASWYNNSWEYRLNITINYVEVDANLTDFPIYLNLSDLPSGFHTNVNSTGKDIRITLDDGTTEIPREVVFYNSATDTGELWFKGNLSSITDSVFYIYYGNPTASDYAVGSTYGANNVWSSGFVGVWHLQEDPSGTAPQMKDSSGNGYDGTSQGSMTSGDLIETKIGKGLDLDGSDDYIQTTNPHNYNDFTILTWFKSPDAPDTRAYDGIFGGGNRGAYWHHQIGSPYMGAAEVEINGNWVNPTFGALSGNTWYLLGLTVENGVVKSFKGGSLVDTISTYAGNNPSANTINFRIGAYSSNEDAIGTIDEVWYFNGAKSVEFISTTHNNQNFPSTFYSVGGEETADTCVCAGLSSNWNVSMADNCVLSEVCNLGTGNLTFYGAGSFTINATLNLKNMDEPPSGSVVWIGSQGKIFVG